MMIRRLTTFGCAAALLIMAGCAANDPTPTLLEKNWGRSFEMARHSQILNPEAEKNMEPVEGLDGEAVLNTRDRYRKDFGKCPPPTVYNVNIAGAVGK